MLERLMLPKDHAIAILMKDHDTVKELFDRFEKTEAKAEKTKIIEEAVMELKIHATIEEELFYPAIRKQVGTELMNEADEEHHVARVLIAELDLGRDKDHRDAKFTVLAESVRHHIKEEEGEIMPKAKSADIDFQALGQEILARKEVLKAKGVPPDAEHAMVANANGKIDTPAAKSRAKTARKSRAKSKAAKSRTKTGVAKSRSKAKKAKASRKSTSAKARSKRSKPASRRTSATSRGRGAGKSGRKAARKSR